MFTPDQLNAISRQHSSPRYVTKEPNRRCWSWKYFISVNEERSKCMFCDFSYRNNTYKFKKHLLSQCVKIPPNYKSEIDSQNDKCEGYYEDPKRPRHENYLKRARMSNPPEPNYLIPMPEDTQIHNILSMIDQNTEERDSFHSLLVKFIVTSDVSPEALQNPYLKELLQKLRPDFNLPSIQDIQRHLDREYDEIRPQISSKIQEAKFLSISLKIDQKSEKIDRDNGTFSQNSAQNNGILRQNTEEKTMQNGPTGTGGTNENEGLYSNGIDGLSNSEMAQYDQESERYDQNSTDFAQNSTKNDQNVTKSTINDLKIDQNSSKSTTSSAMERHIDVFIHTPNPLYYGRVTTGQSRPILQVLASEIDMKKVVAIKTESPEMLSLTKEVEENYPWIIIDRCKGCLVEKTTEELVETEVVKKLWNKASFLVGMFRRPNVRQQISQYDTGDLLETPLEPYNLKNILSLFKATLSQQELIVDAVHWPKLQEEHEIEKAHELTNDKVFWTTLDTVQHILEQFSQTMDSESEAEYQCLLRKTNHIMVEGLKLAHNLDGNDKTEVYNIINKHYQQLESDLGHLYSLLDHVNRGTNLDDDKMDAAMNMIMSKLTQNPALQGDNATIIREIGEFRARTGAFDENRRSWLKSLGEESSQVFWSYFQNTKLAVIANLLSFVPFSSETCQRKNQKQELPEDLKAKLVYLKYNLLQHQPQLQNGYDLNGHDGSVELMQA
ncbi:unnamed protein product [Bursaphelenchus okinawaensis]|uniref:BED-type domain-containing protein n=1 Tax=Bursaphelenchus okinawaensis TaxID=465554 RepID=A0A811JR59_9BILA|nr:unnamed protein product [Bursaphelenchus okinawaensis]CAG9078964.1 unnamed protein product [Bursaphelenchus okinawaensis]